MGRHSLLQGIFSTQGSNLGLLHRRQIPYHLSRQAGLPAFLLSFNATPALGRGKIFFLLGWGEGGLFPSCYSTKLGNKCNLLSLVVVKESTVFVAECQAEQATSAQKTPTTHWLSFSFPVAFREGFLKAN